jgi:hypothetical protein
MIEDNKESMHDDESRVSEENSVGSSKSRGDVDSGERSDDGSCGDVKDLTEQVVGVVF